MEACPQCRSRDLVGFTLAPAGQALRFAHCRTCEHRWWADPDGGALRLPSVLEKIASAA
jgi:hypothetical protein